MQGLADRCSTVHLCHVVGNKFGDRAARQLAEFIKVLYNSIHSST